MNYRGRVMELSLDWSCADLRCMAAEMASEADQEIARMREALSAILYWHERGSVDESWFDAARAALAQESGK